MKFQDAIIRIGLSIKRSKLTGNGLFQKGEENLLVKGDVLSGMNIGNIGKLHKLDPLNESYLVRHLIVYATCS